jgi:hypothetical protein
MTTDMIAKIIAVGRNVILDMDFPEIFNYKVDRDAPLPTGEPVEKLVEEEREDKEEEEEEEQKARKENKKQITELEKDAAKISSARTE